MRWENWHMGEPCDNLPWQHAMSNVATQWHLDIIILHKLASCDVQPASRLYHAMCNFVRKGLRWATLARNGTLRWATWHTMAPCDGQLGMQWHLAMVNLARNGTLQRTTYHTMVPCDVQLGTQRLAMGNVGMQWHLAMGNIAHDGSL